MTYTYRYRGNDAVTFDTVILNKLSVWINQAIPGVWIK